MRQLRLLKTQKHPKGDIEKGAIYTFNEKTEFYEYKVNGIVVSTVNEGLSLIHISEPTRPY